MTNATKNGISKEVLAEAIEIALNATNSVLVEEEPTKANYAKTTTTTKKTKKKAATTTGVISIAGIKTLEELAGKNIGKIAYVMPYALYRKSEDKIKAAGLRKITVMVSDTEYDTIHAFTKGN